MSGSFESVQKNAHVHRLNLGLQKNARVHRLNLGLNSHLTKLGGMESEPMLTPKEKSLLLEAQTHHAGQRAQHTID